MGKIISKVVRTNLNKLLQGVEKKKNKKNVGQIIVLEYFSHPCVTLQWLK